MHDRNRVHADQQQQAHSCCVQPRALDSMQIMVIFATQRKFLSGAQQPAAKATRVTPRPNPAATAAPSKHATIQDAASGGAVGSTTKHLDGEHGFIINHSRKA